MLTRRWISAATFALVAAALWIVPTSFARVAQTTIEKGGLTVARVRSVPDFQTLVLENSKRVRLIGILPLAPSTDSPEAEAMQQKALAYLKSLTEGQGVFLRFDPDVRAGSTITPAYVYRAEDGVFVNASLIDHGYARANQVDYYIHAEAFAKLEKKASRAGVGLWASLPKPKHTATHIEEQSRGTAAPGDDSGPSMDASDAAKGTFSPTTIKSSSDSDKKTKNSKEAKGADHP